MAVKRLAVHMMLKHGTPTVSVEIEGVSRRLIVDTGSNVSILQSGVSKSDVSHYSEAVRSDWGAPRHKGTPVGFLTLEWV